MKNSSEFSLNFKRRNGIIDIFFFTDKVKAAMKWNRSETLALAQEGCAYCHGYGLRAGRQEVDYPCPCVLRAIFRACYRRFRECLLREEQLRTVSFEIASGKQNTCIYGRKNEEYMADFCLVSQRTLGPLEYQIFRYHYLLGANWKLCCRRLKLDQGRFFHLVYRLEARLGRVFRELEPYGLWPLDEYFGDAARKPQRPEPAMAISLKWLLAG